MKLKKSYWSSGGVGGGFSFGQGSLVNHKKRNFFKVRLGEAFSAGRGGIFKVFEIEVLEGLGAACFKNRKKSWNIRLPGIYFVCGVIDFMGLPDYHKHRA